MVSEGVTEKKETKVEDKQAHDYELVLIINPQAEEKVAATVETVTQFITGRGGAMTEVQQWGKRRLAYPIKHFNEGFYVLARFKLNARFAKELKANLLITEEVLRHLLIKAE